MNHPIAIYLGEEGVETLQASVSKRPSPIFALLVCGAAVLIVSNG